MWDDPQPEIDSLLVSARKQDDLFNKKGLTEKFVVQGHHDFHVTLKIVKADPAVRGQTAASSYKPALLENGLRVLGPQFIGSGERIVVDTSDVTYAAGG